MVKKRKYEALYSNLPGRKKNYIDDVPMYGPKKTHLDTVPTGWSPGQFPQPQRSLGYELPYDPRTWINPNIKDLPEVPGQYVYENIPNENIQRRMKDYQARSKWNQNRIDMNTELAGQTPAEQRGMRASYESEKYRAQEAAKREQKEYEANLKYDISNQSKENIRKKYRSGEGISPGVQGAIDRITGDMDTRPNPNPGFPGYKPPSKWPKTPKDSPLFPEEPVGNLPVQPPIRPEEPIQPGQPGAGGGGIVGGGGPLKPVPMPAPDIPPDQIPPVDPNDITALPPGVGPQPPEEPLPGPLGPGQEPIYDPGTQPSGEPNVEEPIDGDYPTGVVTADTKVVRPRIRDARDQVYTPRTILAPPPREPKLTPKWKGAQYERIGATKGYQEPLPGMYKNDPAIGITKNRRIGENVKGYRDIEQMPGQYNIDQQPGPMNREYVDPAQRYQERRPDNWNMKEAPKVGEYGRVSGGGRFGEERPRGYDTPDSPDIARPDLVDAPEMYQGEMPTQMPWRDIPGERNYDKVNIGAGFDKPLPGQKDIGAAPTSREKDFDYRKLGTPETVGRMRDRVWRPEMKEADYSDIKGPEKMAALKDAQMGKFDDLAQWDKGKQGPYRRQVYEGDKYASTRAGMADAARSIFTKGVGFQDAASTAHAQERDRQHQFETRQDNREQVYGQLQQADRQQRLAEQQFKFGLQKQISDQGIQIRGQDLDYIKEGARLGMQEFQTRLTERMGHNADKLKFNEQLISEAQNFNQADQNLQSKNIDAAATDRGLAAQYAQQDNATTTAKIAAQQSEDRLDFDKWAKTQDLTQGQYDKALNAWSLEQQAKYGQQTLGVEAQKFNVQSAQKQYDQALNAWSQEEAGKDKRFGNALAARQEGRATLQDFQVLKQKQQEFNSGAGQEYQKMLQQQYRDQAGVAGQKAKFGLESWQAGQGAEEQYQQRQQRAAEFNVGTDIKSFDQKLNAYDKEMGYTKANFDSALDRWKAGEASEHDFQVLKFAQDKQNIDQGNAVFDRNLERWDKGVAATDRKLRTDIDRWKTGADDHYKNLEEKRLRFGLNEKEQRDYDSLNLNKWQIEQDVKDKSMNTNLKRWNEGKDLYKFESEEERQRFADNNKVLATADANAINKYGQDVDLWKAYNKLPSDIRKDEAMADNYMNWYAQEQMKIKSGKEQDPLEMSKYYDTFNNQWTGDPAWKDYDQAGKSFNKIIAAPATGFGDMSAIYGFIRSIDPMTGVREGERDFVQQVMGWWDSAKEKGLLNNMPKGIARPIKKLETGELLTVDDRELLANAAYAATNTQRNAYGSMLNQHIKTWKSQPHLANQTEKILRLPNYFGEYDNQGNKLAEPGWQVKLRQKYLESQGYQGEPTNETRPTENKKPKHPVDEQYEKDFPRA